MNQPQRQVELGFGYWVEERSLPRFTFSERPSASPAIPPTSRAIPSSKTQRRPSLNLRTIQAWTTSLIAFSVGG